MSITATLAAFGPLAATSAGSTLGLGGASAGLGGSLLGAAGLASLGSLGSMGMSGGINAAQASKSHDRSKNWATRKYLYELIALKEAGINPAYMFMNNSAAMGGAGAQKAAQAQGTGAVAPNISALALVPAQIEQMKAQANSANSAAMLNTALAGKARAETPGLEASSSIRVLQAKAAHTQEGRRAIQEAAELAGVPESASKAFIAFLSGKMGSQLASGPIGSLDGFDALQKARTPEERAAAISRMRMDMIRTVGLDLNYMSGDVKQAVMEFALDIVYANLPPWLRGMLPPRVRDDARGATGEW